MRSAAARLNLRQILKIVGWKHCRQRGQRAFFAERYSAEIHRPNLETSLLEHLQAASHFASLTTTLEEIPCLRSTLFLEFKHRNCTREIDQLSSHTTNPHDRQDA